MPASARACTVVWPHVISPRVKSLGGEGDWNRIASAGATPARERTTSLTPSISPMYGDTAISISTGAPYDVAFWGGIAGAATSGERSTGCGASFRSSREGASQDCADF